MRHFLAIRLRKRTLLESGGMSQTCQSTKSLRDSPLCFFFASRRRNTRFKCDWSSDVCSSDLNIFDRNTDRLAVRHLRFADRRFDAELTAHPVDENFQVQLAHARNDGLAGFFVGLHPEGRIFLSQPVQRDTHLFLVRFPLPLTPLPPPTSRYNNPLPTTPTIRIHH